MSVIFFCTTKTLAIDLANKSIHVNLSYWYGDIFVILYYYYIQKIDVVIYWRLRHFRFKIYNNKQF